MKPHVRCLSALFALLLLASCTCMAQGTSAIHVSCWGSRRVCLEWHHKGSNIWHQIKGTRIYEDPYPWGLGSTCPVGYDSTDTIFLFDPESGSTGIGFVGCPVCVGESANSYIAVPNSSTTVFSDYASWHAAAE